MLPVTLDSDSPLFACDAMLGGLARWLRAAGYDASWRAGIDDWDLVRQAQREGRVLLSSDTGIFRIGIVRDGEVPALFVPHGLDKAGQLGWVLQQLTLSPREPRCMACGGPLTSRGREEVRGRVPEKTFAWLERFEECGRCGRVFWQGTHWQRIAEQLRNVVGPPISAGSDPH
jgi:uncharacterized protein with PIN domain